MNKSLLNILVGSTLALSLSGCFGDKAPIKTEPDFSCHQDGQRAPEWACNPYLEGSISALGIAEKNAGDDYGMQRAEAIAEGRDSLANQLSVKVSTLFKSYKGTTGSGADGTFDKSTSKVSKQLASEVLSGSKAVESWRSDKGTLYVLVGLSNEPVKAAMEKAVKTSYKSDKAMYQKFLASQAQGELDAELEKSGQ